MVSKNVVEVTIVVRAAGHWGPIVPEYMVLSAPLARSLAAQGQDGSEEQQEVHFTCNDIRNQNIREERMRAAYIAPTVLVS